MGAQASITRKEMGPPLNMRLTENQGSDGPTKRLHLSAVSFLRDLFHSQAGLKCAGGLAMIEKAVKPSLLSVLIVCGFAAWAQSFDLPVGPGKEIVENTCGRTILGQAETARSGTPDKQRMCSDASIQKPDNSRNTS